jgi:hypothetical protein
MYNDMHSSNKDWWQKFPATLQDVKEIFGNGAAAEHFPALCIIECSKC